MKDDPYQLSVVVHCNKARTETASTGTMCLHTSRMRVLSFQSMDDHASVQPWPPMMIVRLKELRK